MTYIVSSGTLNPTIPYYTIHQLSAACIVRLRDSSCSTHVSLAYCIKSIT